MALLVTLVRQHLGWDLQDKGPKLNSRIYWKPLSLFLFLLAAYLLTVNWLWIYLVADGQIVSFSLKRTPWAAEHKQLYLEVVKNPDSLQQGLSGRPLMISSSGYSIDGMLFLLPGRQLAHFWMPEMNFDLDICWLDRQKFLDCQRQVPAKQADGSANPVIYSSPQAVSTVLETVPGVLTEQDLELKLYPQLSSLFYYRHLSAAN